MRENWIIEDANRLLNNIFIFDHPWDMEPCSIPRIFHEKIEWDSPFNDDEEWTFMLSRFRFCETLTQAYLITNNDKYIIKAKELLFDFINNTDIDNNPELYRSIDAALRVMHVLKSIQYLKLTIDEKTQLDTFLEKQLFYLLNCDNHFLKVSNWGAITDCGAFSLLFYFEDSLSIDKKSFNKIENRILSNLERSIFDDGYHFEMSPMYHVEVLLALLQLIEIKKINQNKYSQIRIEEYALKLAKMLIYTMKNNYKIFNQGDSDDTSLVDLMTYISFILKSPFLKSIARDKLPSFFSNSDQEKYKKIKKEKIFNENISLKESGNFYLRYNDLTTHFRCGFIASGHCHNDLLHFDLVKNGIDIFVDSGRYTYTETPIRTTLKMASAHNSIVLNDEDCLNPIDSWKFGNQISYSNNNIVEKNGISFVEGTNYSYKDATIKRSLIQIENQILIIVDKINSTNNVKVNRYFHFDNKGIVTKEQKKITYRVTDFSCFLNILDDDQLDLINTPYSKKYNELEEKKTLKIESYDSETLKVCVICFDNNLEIEEHFVYHGASSKKLDKTNARAFSIKSKEEINILIQNEINTLGVSTIYSKNIEGFGNILVKKDNQIVRLK